jgi:hypothetical protein
MENYLSLLQLAKECPGLQVTITLGELVEANRLLIAEAKRELEQEIADSKAETYVSRAQAMQILGKGSTTLWRWKKLGYLVPVTVGAIDRYRMSDIRRIMEGGGDPAAQEGDAV